MSSVAPVASHPLVFKRATFKQAAVLLAVAWLVPLLVHLLPWSGARPLGAHLLPMFWTAFAALWLYGFRLGLAAALVAPVVNLLMTGLPLASGVTLMALELTVFVVVAWLALNRGWRGWWLAPLAYLAARLLTFALALLLGWRSGIADLGPALLAALPGLAMLAVIKRVLQLRHAGASPASGDDSAGV